MSGPDTAQPGRSPPPGAPQCLPSPRRTDRMGVLSGLPGLRGGQGLGVTGVTSRGQRRGRTHAWPSPYPRICGRARAAEALGRASGGPRPRPGAGVAGAHVRPAPPPARGLRGLLSARSVPCPRPQAQALPCPSVSRRPLGGMPGGVTPLFPLSTLT